MSEAKPAGAHLAANLGRVLATASPRVRRLLYLTLLLTGAGAVAELVTIGAVLPILAIAAAPDAVADVPLLGPLLTTVATALEIRPIAAAGMLLVAAALVATLVRLLLAWVSQNFVYGLQRDLVMAVYGRALNQPYEWYVRQNSSVLIAGLEKIFLVTNGVMAPLVLAATSAVMAICIIAFLVLIDPVTALVAASSIGLIYLAISLVVRKTLRKASTGLAEVYTARVKTMQETLGGIRDIILDQSQRLYEVRQARLEDRLRRLITVAVFLGMAPRFLVEGAAIVLVACAAVWFSGRPGGVIEAIPVLGALGLGAQRLLPMIQAIYLGWNGSSLHADTLQDVVDLLDAPIETAERRESSEPVRRFERAIELRQVSFSYHGGRTALADIDLTIRKGERIGLIGKTGSGKSTLVDIVMGLLKPTSGTLAVDGVTIGDSNLANWKAQIAHVPQAIFLADDSIAANIAFGDPADGIDIDRVEAAARGADLFEFIQSLPDGMSTSVGERGIRLSGGQRQRIGIARALYKKASVLVLDEATSALDDETEAAVMASVAKLDRELTVILIAHRLSTVSVCERIYRLNEGRMAEQGSYAKVIGGARS